MVLVNKNIKTQKHMALVARSVRSTFSINAIDKEEKIHPEEHTPVS